MRSTWVHVTHDFDAPRERVFDYLAEHEHLGDVFGTRVKRLRDGDHHRNGVGSRRRLQIGPLPPFEETVTEFTPNERIVYKITKGSPMRNHIGIQEFTDRSDGQGCHLDYRIRLSSVVPGIAPAVKAVLTKSITDAMDGVERAAQAGPESAERDARASSGPSEGGPQ